MKWAAKSAANRGAFVIISNSDTAFVRGLYKDADSIEEISVNRSISGLSTGRNKVGELIVTYRKMA